MSPILGTHNTSFFPDKCVDREIKDLAVICENKENGCTWSDSLGNYEVQTHLPVAEAYSEPRQLFSQKALSKILDWVLYVSGMMILLSLSFISMSYLESKF